MNIETLLEIAQIKHNRLRLYLQLFVGFVSAIFLAILGFSLKELIYPSSKTFDFYIFLSVSFLIVAIAGIIFKGIHDSLIEVERKMGWAEEIDEEGLTITEFIGKQGIKKKK